MSQVGDKQMEASSLTAIANIRLSLLGSLRRYIASISERDLRKELNVAEAAARDALRIFRELWAPEAQRSHRESRERIEDERYGWL